MGILFILLLSSLPILFTVSPPNPQKTDSIPDVTLSSLETQILELNQYYSGNLLNYTFVDPHNEYFSYIFEPSYINKSYLEMSIESRFQVKAHIILDMNMNKTHKLFCVSLLKNNILMASIVFLDPNFNFSKAAEKTIEKNLNCDKMTRFSNRVFLVQCSDQNNGIIFLKVSMIIDQNIFIFNLTKEIPLNFTTQVTTSPEFDACPKDFKILGFYLFLFCKATNSLEGSNALYLFIYDVSFDQIYYYDTIDQSKINKNLSIQDISFIDSIKVIFVLDYIKGVLLLRYNVSQKTAIVYSYDKLIDSNFYTILYIKNGLGSYQKQEQGSLLISSKSYLTELQIETSYSIYLSKRIIYDDDFITEKVYFSDTHYFILCQYSQNNNQQEKNLLAYERRNNQSFILEKFEFDAEESIYFLELNYNLENGKNIFLYFSKDSIIFFQISSPKLYLFAKMLPRQDDLFVNFTYSIYSRDYKQGSMDPDSEEFLFFLNDKILITIFDLNDTSLKLCICQNQTFSYVLNFPTFSFPFKNLVKGPAKQFLVLSNQSNFSAEIKNTQISNEGSLNYDNSSLNINYLMFFKSDEYDFLKFVQYDNYSAYLSKCSKEDPNYCILINGSLFGDLIKEVYVDPDTIVISWVHDQSNLAVYSYSKEFFFPSNPIIIPDKIQCDSIVSTKYSYKGLCIDNIWNAWYLFNLFDYNNNNFMKIFGISSGQPFYKVDISLIDNNIILASNENGLSVFFYDQNENQTNLAGLFPMACKQFYCDFLIFLSNTKNIFDIKLILIDYSQNMIAEYMANNLLNPQILRVIPIYNYNITPDFLKLVNNYLVISALNINSTLCLLNFDLLEQTENILTKTLLLFDLNFYSLDNFSSEDITSNQFEFILVNKTSQTFRIYIIYDFEFVGRLKMENVSISGEIINNTLYYNVTSNETQRLPVNVKAMNEFREEELELPVFMNFQFQETFLNFSQKLYSELGNITNLDFGSDVKEIELQQFFSGPIINYQIDKPDPQNKPMFYLKTKMELEKINFLQKREFFGNVEILDSMIHYDYLFILDPDSLKIFDAKNDLKSVKNYTINNYFHCDSLFRNDEKPIIFIQCNNYKAENLWIMMLNFTNSVFPTNLTTYGNKSMTLTDMKIIGKWLFLVRKIYESLNESQIDIYEIQDQNLNYLSSITAESLKFNYLFVNFLNIQFLNDSKSDDEGFFGLVFVQQFSIVYCEISIQGSFVSGISNVMTIEFLDILNSLNDYKILQIDNNLTGILNLCWKKLDSNHSLKLIISSNFHTIESSHERNNFSDYNITFLLVAYLQCENYFKGEFQIIDNFFINYCIFSNYDFDCTPNKYYLSLYNRNENTSTINSFNKTHVVQALVYDLNNFSDYFIYKLEDGIYYLFVLYPNYQVLQYRLNETTYLVKNDNHTLDLDLIERYEFKFFAFNDYSNISIKISINYHINPLDVTKFVFFVILPLMIAIVCIFGTHFFIGISRKKRKDMIMEQFTLCKEQKNHDFEVNWLGSNDPSEQQS